MYSLVMLLLFLVSASLTDKCDSSAYKLVIFALSNDYNDALERFRCSTKRYNIDFEIFDFGQSSNRHGNRREIGKLLRMLAGKLKIFGASNSTILLIIDGFDAIIASDENDIICLFLNACSNCRALLTPKATPNQDEILSIALMGFVPNVLNVLDFIGSQDGKTLSYNGLYSDDSMNTLGLTFDVKRILFQNIDGASSDIMLLFHDSGDAYVHNFLRNTHPSIILGSNKGSQLLNYLGNYIGKAWSVENGYQQCGSRSLLQTTNDTLPSITLALFINKPIPFVREFLAAINRMSYPASKIDLYVYNSQKYNEKDIEEFLKNAKKLYRTVEYDSNDTELGEKEARKAALIFTEELLNDFVFMLDGDVHLIIPETLQLLVETATVGNFNIIAPLLTLHGKLFSNFWGALDSNGYYSRSEDYIEIVDRKRVGVWNVPYISKAILINKSKVKMLENSYTYNVMVDTDMSFCEYARAMGYFMHVDNQRYYGFLVDTEDFINNDGRLHPEMYEIFKNRHIWEQRYIHPKYYEALDSRDIHQSCPDVYDYPLMSENFTKELIEEIEHYGYWSSGKKEGNRLADEYEIVPTVDIHMSQINFEKEWSYFLDEYVRPMQEKLFIGYYQKPVEAVMMFVVRYKQNKRSFLRAYYDASTYIVNIPLNKRGKDYEGGGIHYVRYNCTVSDDQTGYATMFPGRLTHLHEGLPVTSGTRYIAMSFLNP
ncbi:Multifunctional procollagen lysine hydroxylase and glycosyltransferase [Dirofilaria immitis]